MNNPTFYYPYKPIANLEKLAISLGISLEELIYLKSNSDSFFFLHKRKQKADGTFRDTYNVKPRLKIIHAKIAKHFFKILNYPEYLQGGIAKRSCITNANQHIGAEILIKEDISNFFPTVSKKIVYQVWTDFFHFSHDVADYLSELVTYKGYLVQGCKVSGFLCNVILWQREMDLVRGFQKQGLTYTRFVDDVTVSTKRKLGKKTQQEIISKIYSLFRSIGVNANRKKHQSMLKGTQQTVNNINISTKNLTLPKNKQKEIRSAVFQCERAFEIEKNKSNYEKIFNSVQGKVLYLHQFNQNQANHLLMRLNKIQPKNFQAA
ncbi:reverse transcriptase family protein [Kingella kingae]|uniref:reverse transcriptase family protein n=1 Tax=Kingella kingae TaxID=504 RepID=UPI00254BABE1|nr:reverse transcriptase family protein [Kingella kingae]MDK4536581.1 reverse transcriptase family protein [Kingella kingae]MDK4539002.1 reverse transcriptase family protein [Kingella kingae]MDK4547686.1 reverse transcriptase family protein [Kingella kingae]MDK4623513.1 reverse transcriptase family protein [Kingella kingae]